MKMLIIVDPGSLAGEDDDGGSGMLNEGRTGKFSTLAYGGAIVYRRPHHFPPVRAIGRTMRSRDRRAMGSSPRLVRDVNQANRVNGKGNQFDSCFAKSRTSAEQAFVFAFETIRQCPQTRLIHLFRGLDANGVDLAAVASLNPALETLPLVWRVCILQPSRPLLLKSGKDRLNAHRFDRQYQRIRDLQAEADIGPRGTLGG